MASDRLLYDFKGQITAPGRLARAEASCIATKNVVFDAPGVVRKRRGWRRIAGNLTNGIPWKIFSCSTWGADQVISTGLSAGPRTLEFVEYDAGVNTLTQILLPDGGQIRGTPQQRVMGAQSLKSFFLAALDAPVRIEPNVETTFQARYAGMPRGLPAHRGFALSGAPGTLLPDGYARAYRVTWHRYDSDGVLLSGPPTARWVIRNQAGSANYVGATTKDALFNFYIPMEFGTDATKLSSEYFWRLWGTRTFNAAGGEEGDDEMYLLQERSLTAAEIAANEIAGVTDSTPNDFLQRQLGLNTNATNFPAGELGLVNGLVNADEPPPVAYEVSTWANVAWWSDVRYRPQGTVTFLSTGGTLGLQDNDTVTVQIGATPIALRAKLVPALGGDFQLYTGLATVQMNLEATAQAFAALVNAIAISFGVPVRAYTVGLPTSLGGVVYFEAARIDTTTLTGLQFVSSRSTWYQYNGSLSGFGTNGYGGEARNAVCFSKPQRADAVPLINRLYAGPNNARVIRTQPYRNKQFVFTDQGVYVITGSSFADFAIQEFALDLTLLARESVCVCDDAVYAWCVQGIAKLTDGGWEIISTPIEPTLQTLILDVQTAGNPSVEPFAGRTFAVADGVQHRVLFWYPEFEAVPGGVYGCALALAYDTRTGAWSNYVLDGMLTIAQRDQRAHGCVRFSDKRVLLTSQRNVTDSEGYVFEEKMDFAPTDFSDDFSTSLSSPIPASLQLQFQMPDAGGAQHWLQTVLQLDGGEFAWRPLPTGVGLHWETETQASGSTTAVPSKKVLRVEPPRAVRRGNQLSVTITHSIAEYFGLVGVQQRFVPGSVFAGGKNR